MSVRFEKVSRFKDVDLPLPTRSTKDSAGYDFVVAEDIVLPPIDFFRTKIQDKVFERQGSKSEDYFGFLSPMTLDDMAVLTKELKAKVPLVSTGMKVYLGIGQYLELSVRSSTPLKHWLIMGNSVGIIDRDYVDNPDNEGEIFFQIMNLSPFAIQLRRGDRIGQGIVKRYGMVDDDAASGDRSGGFGSTGNQPIFIGDPGFYQPVDPFIPAIQPNDWPPSIQPNDWPPMVITCKGEEPHEIEV